MEYTATIEGELASKSNSRRVVWFKGKRRVIKSAKALSFQDSAIMQLVKPKAPLLDSVQLVAHIYYASMRPDLDDTLLCDLLQKAGVIGNDRQIVEKHLYRHKDKARPRVELELKEIPWPSN